MSHGLIRAVGDQVAGVGEDTRSHGGLGVDAGLLFARVDVPETARVVGGSGQEVLGLPVHVQAPHGTAVALGVTIVAAAEGSCKKNRQLLVYIVMTFNYH